MALLGTNGAGKTTALETIEGHRRPSSGEVRLLGRDPRRHRRTVRRHVGIMLQESGFAGELTVSETVRMWARLRHEPSDPARALATVELEHRLDVRVQDLSGGERRRLDFAVASLGSPQLLFLDEPTTGLDPESRSRLLDTVSAMVRAGTAVLLTTHYLEEAERLADRIVIMHEGQVRVAGTQQEVLDRRPARIRFRLPAGRALCSGFPHPPVPAPQRLPDGQVLVQTHELQRDLRAVLDWADAEGLDLAGLAASSASLEDVFASVSRGSDVELLPVGEEVLAC